MVSFTEIRKPGRGLGMEIQNSVLDTVSMRCHVVALNRQPAAKTGMEREEEDRDTHGEISKSGCASCGTGRG